jgi:hypothetical protein
VSRIYSEFSGGPQARRASRRHPAGSSTGVNNRPDHKGLGIKTMSANRLEQRGRCCRSIDGGVNVTVNLDATGIVPAIKGSVGIMLHALPPCYAILAISMPKLR